jgi:hypothetical protein
LVALLATWAIPAGGKCQEADPQSRPEKTNYEETSTYEDVVTFFRELQRQSPLVRIEWFGKTNEGRDLPLVIVADPPVFFPREALASGKPIVFVIANIHGGEVEGKESVQHLARRMIGGDLRPLADKVITLIAPIYNADGNERFAQTSRSRQYGPIGGVGERHNAQNLDLNRDYTKLEAPESRALVKLLSDWDPHITVDLHTTNGSYHAYHLTYSIPLNPSIDERIMSYHRDTMMPAIAKTMLDRHNVRMYYYGNISTADGRGGGPAASGRGGRGRGRRGGRGGEPAGERGAEQGTQLPVPGGRSGPSGESARGGAPTAQAANPPALTPVAQPAETAGGAEAAQPRLRQWRAFSHLPRVGQNYVGFRNRLTILSESYSYLHFRERIDTTAQFVEEIIRYAIDHADEIHRLTRQADADAIRQAMGDMRPRIGVEYELRPLPEPVEILVGEVMQVENPRTGRNMTAMVPDKITPERMQDYGVFAATRNVPVAYAYVFPPEDGLRVVVDKLLAHGIAVEELTVPLSAEATTFRIAGVTQSARAFEGHRETSLAGAYETESAEFPAGTLLVRTAQPLGRLAAYLLEPESDDSLATWNFLDSYLEAGRPYPIRKLMKPVSAASRSVKPE